MNKILFVLTDLQGGGAERVIIRIIKSINRKQFTPVLFLLKNNIDYSSEMPRGIEVISVLNSNQRIFFNLPKLFYKLLRTASSCHLIIGGLELTPTYFAILTGLILRRPTIGWLHINLKYYPPALAPIHSLLLKFLYPFLHRIIAVSHGVAKDFIQIFPKLKTRVKVVYNPICLNEVKALANSQIDVNHSIPIILNVGRLDPQKNLQLLLRAHAQLISEGIEHKLFIIGKGSELESLKSLVKKLKIDETVIFKGFLENPYPWIKIADALILSSNFEGLGMVLLEAMTLGTPVISTDCPSGPSEILKGGSAGILVPKNDFMSLAKAIKQILTNPQSADYFKTAGLERAKLFDVKFLIPEIETLFLETLRR
jgi:glycosyltransferase involved in cell wall biosynthesis